MGYYDLSVRTVAINSFLKKNMNWCYGLNVCVSTKFVYWDPNSQCDGISMWGLWKVLRSWGWSPMNVIHFKTWQLALPTLCHVMMHREDSPLQTRRGVLTRIESAGTLTQDFAAFRTVRNKCWLIKLPSVWWYIPAAWGEIAGFGKLVNKAPQGSAICGKEFHLQKLLKDKSRSPDYSNWINYYGQLIPGSKSKPRTKGGVLETKASIHT